MTPSERFTAREERQHAMQTRIERANEAYARFHEPTDAEIDAELKTKERGSHEYLLLRDGRRHEP